MKPHQQVEYEMMKEEVEKSMPALLGAYAGIAKLTWSYYEELKKQGFSDQQALHIVSVQGYMAGNGPSN